MNVHKWRHNLYVTTVNCIYYERWVKGQHMRDVISGRPFPVRVMEELGLKSRRTRFT